MTTPSILRSLCACALGSIIAAGCSGGGGGAASATAGASAATPSSGGTANGQSVVSQTQWQVALAALAGGAPVPSFDDASLARWNGFLAQGWSNLDWRIAPVIQDEITKQLQSLAGPNVVNSIRGITVDIAAPPAFSSGGAPTRLVANMPAPGATWSIDIGLEIGRQVTTTVVGIPVTANLTLDVDVHVSGVHIVAPLDFDMSNPRRPVPGGVAGVSPATGAAGAPQLQMQLSITSSSTLPIIQTVIQGLQTALDPIVRIALLAGAQVAQQQVGVFVGQVPPRAWGTGGPAVTAVSAPVDLRQLAAGVDDEIRLHHIPFGTMVLPAQFDQPGYGNGTPVGFTDYGDSAIWTGHYLTSQAIRFELTGDADALANATTVLDGLQACLDIDGPQSGLLGRCAVPLSSPHITDISGWGAYYTGVHNGVAMGALGYISRDQYIGAMLGFTEAWLRIPALRAKSASCIGRVLNYLSNNSWGAIDHNGGAVTAPFETSPDALWAFVKAGNLTDRATWGPLHDANRDLSRVFWFPIWISSREVHDGYFKFNLMHSSAVMLAATESDPVLYREYWKGIEIMREVTGFHQNQWFDAVYAATVPSAAPQVEPLLELELQHWALRDRRDRGIGNSSDPTIQKVLYTSTLSPGAQPQWCSVYPIPIEKRVSGDFIGQTDPFQLDGGGDPHHQQPGIDLVLPYWMARSYGLLK